METASLCCVIPISLRKSSISISPGCTGGNLSVVVNDLNLLWSRSGPPKIDPPLAVNSNTVLTLPIAFQCFEAVSRRNPQLLKALCVAKLTQFTQRH